MIIIRLFLQPYRNADAIGGFSFLEKYDSCQAAILPRRESKKLLMTHYALVYGSDRTMVIL